MNIGKRLVFHVLLAMLLVVAVFLSIFAAITILGDREAGMVLGRPAGLVLGQLGFSYRFLSAPLWVRFVRNFCRKSYVWTVGCCFAVCGGNNCFLGVDLSQPKNNYE